MSKSSSEIVRVTVGLDWPFVTYCYVEYESGVCRNYLGFWPKTVLKHTAKYGLFIGDKGFLPDIVGNIDCWKEV